ncbi:PqqD family peptide modification chaperone [Nocardioides bizhenqiangii]|uniref:PqqD family peptide modification chaperone n=1 Tax=Nocardioides bizhenqiangii TaxID=3095076 RepID=A0ABZ0ZR72_9ACTN|nr:MULTISPECIES: PqqD family peptide modification chaperone [unclassified Nocardioides]MDZ5620025.1 PqqD family peptide modification chaperone [Nocardioides sp. HM23]WQQ25973.1 PqqD family peptide modification chaperone [Nocardioides sp. HM61]
MIDPGSTVARNDGVVEAQFDETRVVLNEDLAYLGLNEVGQQIWDLIESPRTLASLVAELVEDYDVSEADCTRDVTRYVEALVEHKLVRLS